MIYMGISLFGKKTIELEPYTEEELNKAIKEYLQKSNNEKLSENTKKKYLRLAQWLSELCGRKYKYKIPEQLQFFSANRLVEHCNYVRHIENSCQHCCFSSINKCDINYPYKWNIEKGQDFE